MIIYNRRVEKAHHTQDPQILTIRLVITLRIHIQITLDHNQLIIIEMEINHDDLFLVIDIITYDTTLTHFKTANKQTTQFLILKIQRHKTI